MKLFWLVGALAYSILAGMSVYASGWIDVKTQAFIATQLACLALSRTWK